MTEQFADGTEMPMTTRWRGKALSECSRAELDEALAYILRRPLLLFSNVDGRQLTEEECNETWQRAEVEIRQAMTQGE